MKQHSVNFRLQRYLQNNNYKQKVKKDFLKEKDETKKLIINLIRSYINNNNSELTANQKVSLEQLRQTIQNNISKEINQNQVSETNKIKSPVSIKNIFSGKLFVVLAILIGVSFLFLYSDKTTSGSETNLLLIGDGKNSTANPYEVVPNEVANVYRGMLSSTSNETIVGIIGATVFSQVVHQVGISNQTETYKQFNLTLEETKNQITNETASLLPLAFDDIKMFFKLNFLKEYNQPIIDMEDFLVDGKVDIYKIKRLTNTEFTILNREINNSLKNLPQIDTNVTANLDFAIMKETIKTNWNTDSFDIDEMMNVVNNYFANKDKFPINLNIPAEKEIENRLKDAHYRIKNKSLFGFGYLTGFGYGTLTSEDKIKIDETLQFFSQMKNEVMKLDDEMKENKKQIEKNIGIQEIETAREKDKNYKKAEKKDRQQNIHNIKNDQNYKREQIEIRNKGQYPKITRTSL